MIKCRSCNSEKIIEVLNLGEQYLSDFVDKDQKVDKYPLNLVMCKECTLVQLNDTTPPQSLYTERYGYKSGINDTMRDHLAAIVLAATLRIKLEPQDVVIDIGANDGSLIKYYPPEVWKVVYEPIKKYAEECTKYAHIVFNDFFNPQLFLNISGGKKAKVITAISMFYDLDDPNEFVSGVAQILDPQGLFIIQQNYLSGMLEQNAFDNIVHEHLEYYSLTSLEKLLNRHGLEVVEVEENNLNGGSFRTFVKHMDTVKKMRYKERQLKLDKQGSYFLFSLRVRQNKKKLMEFLNKEKLKGKKIYLYGASTRGNTLIQYCGITKDLIPYAVERNPEKWGKYYGGSGIEIISEEQARKDKPNYFLVLPWFFKDEIVKREEEFRKQGGKLIFPLPQFEVI